MSTLYPSQSLIKFIILLRTEEPNKCNFLFVSSMGEKASQIRSENLHFSFPFKVCLSPTFHPEEGYLLCLSLSPLRISYDLSNGPGKTSIFERKCALLIIRKKTWIWLISPWNFNLVFLWWYFSNYSMLLPHKIKLQSKNFQTPNGYNCLSHMVFISSKMSLVIGIFLWKSFKKWSL